ncbi:BapA prefix-like domain-containing protein [Pseudomonas sp. MG-2]|uniref:Ig-like domain-containing protein n=1 Tax=Pseudomonas sp. MG-2 TaxID=405714 RepID=UPI001C001585|nr:Ig-like domain-containing protein [Pseudomonas sp. MG-2]MBT9236782.1 BapA prefix-like domain-containing protein [Pseudomonas sp. MG-2]
MSIQAKVSPLAQSVTSAAPIAIPDNGILTLTQSSNIVLDIAPESVTGYEKSGADLIVQLKSGESLRIANFYAEGQPASQLYLVDRDKLLAVDLPPVAADGPLVAGYVPQETPAGFESLTGTDGTIAGLSPGGALLAGAAIIGGGVAIANSNGGGGGGGDSSVQPDTTAPAPASGLQIAPDGSSISGTAEPGATVGIDSNGDGQTDVSVVVGSDGKFQIPLDPPLTNGETVSVVVTDPAGNSSPPATVQAPDFPDAPQINPSNGSSLSGTAQPGSTVVLTDGNGNPIGQTTVDSNGNWSYTPDSPLPDGTVINAVVVDAAGNSGPPASTIIDGVAPAAPVINPSNGTELSGTAEPNSTVTLTDGDGNPIGQVTADGSGNWTYTPGTPIADGTVINVVAQDAAGNTSAPTSTTVDAQAPATPVVNPSNGTTISGTAEPGSTVTLTDGSGNPIGQVTADGSGNWSFTPGSPLPNGTVVNATATDLTGNTSAPSSTTVDTVAPAAPVVEPSNGSEISGTAEPGSTITLTDGSGNPIGQTTADGSGNWSFTPGTPLPDGTVINATATDPAGNTSGQASTTVDTVAPAAPVIEPSNGSEISGTAEPSSTITLTDGSGNPIGQTTADGSGNWSFTPGTPLPDGTVVNATATDPAGNTGGQGSTTVDGVAPAVPTINLSNGSSLSGTAEPNSTVTLTDGSGNPIGEATADGSGNWTFTPATPLPNGTVVNATASDAAGNTGPAATVTVDSSAPAAPVINPSNGASISGTAEAGATVTLTDGSGNPIGQITADGSGNWSFTPGSPLANGSVIIATATDPTGNTGPQAATTVDSVAPAAPVIEPSNGSEISGTAEPGSTITLTDGSGNPIGQTTADGSGNWSFTPGTPLPDGTVVNATATDPAGNTSGPSSTTVDGVAPGVPTIDLSNGSSLSGTAEPNSTVTLTDGSGNPIGVATADGSGNWTFTPATPLPNGTVVNATASDAAGNTGSAATVTVDSSAPAAPVINPSNGATISGTAEAGATVTLTDFGGNPIGQITADGSGNWSFTPGSPLANGTVIIATATDPTGNTGPQAATTVDSVAPAAPVVEPSNGSEISGTAEPGSRVILTDGSGNPIGQTTVDGNGNWSFTPGTPLANGTVVNAVAQDPAGNTGPQGSTTVDSIAPAAPVVNPSNGAVLNGTAEPNSTVTLTDGSGNPIGEATADGSGNWTFTPGTQLPDGTVVNATATDAAGNTGAPGSTTVDSSLPSIPQVDPSNGSVISGTADANNTIILTDGSGNPIGQVSADGSGNWSFTPGVPLPDGTVVNVVARNPGGTDSAPAIITVDGVAPAAPVVEPSNGTEISGTAEAGATVILTDGGGNPIGQTTADGSGNWSFTPGTPLANGTVINAVAQDPAGNTSGPASVTVDAIAPAAPIINPSNGVVISGTAEAGAKVILTNSSGNPIGETTADGSGNWAFTPAPALANGTVINAVAQDPSGNTSGPTSTIVDTTAPAAPVINPSNGVVISGTAEIGAKVILTDGSGNPIGQTTADGSGNWSFTPGTPLANGTVINAVAQDAAGNTSSPQVSTTVDAVAPGQPTIEPSNGTEISGTAEAGAKVILTDGSGNPIGETTADGSGNWSFTPGTPLANGTVINAVAQDPAGNTSAPVVSTTVDAIAPATPTIEPSNGVVLAGTAEPGATVILTDGGGNPIGETTADGSGDWSFTPTTPLPNGTVVNAVAEDAAGNTSGPASTTVDTVAPSAPLLSISADGALLTGTAEPNSQVRLVIDGDTANPITVNVDGSGNFSLPFAPPLITGELISGVSADAAGNLSGPSMINAPDLAPPTISVPEAADTWINAAEISDGIQVDVTIRPTMQVGQVITVAFAGQNGYETQATHTITAGDILAGSVTVTIPPGGGMGPFPEGASTVTADINGGTTSSAVPFTVDTIPPATPVLSLVGSILTISTDPGTDLTVEVDIGGVTATATVTADNSGLASLNLLTDLDIDLTLDQLLNAQVSVTGEDPAGNTSNVATIGVGSSIEQPVTIGNFGVDVSLNPLSPRFGFSGVTEPDSSVVIRVITPALNVELLPITADNSGNFSLNLLSPTVLTQLGLNITDILNLGSQISFNIVATDTNGNDSSAYGITLAPAGLSLNIGQIDVNGTSGDDVMSGANGSSEHINGGNGNDLIFNVGTGDQVVAGDGNDAIQITATNFTSIDGGAGFDTLVLADGIDLDYNAVGVGTLSNIERIDLGRGDSGSVLTLTAAEVDAITDANNVLQITGESNDTLNVVGAVNTGTTQQLNGITYDVYNFGSSTLLIEDNTVQVVV